ncbi:TonB-dependent receptor [Luteibaculum oceani]|uniref:TonB-dependent receptor n=1 Tax=Luteibaculum oceani TaxID=1294296 RepID=A0A5C6VEX9_9FLAO|nr:TonB-dependent receptor [Luteibaculum oceani]TXC81758.1 TonB-dependent receptor [Luteibaculum oceani]
MAKYLVFLLLWLPGFLLANHCKNRISGIVSDEVHNESLSYANIYIPELGVGTVANEKGEFAFEEVCDGSYTLKVSHIGCKTEYIKLTVTEDVFITVSLNHNAELLETIAVNADKGELGAGASKSRVVLGSPESSSQVLAESMEKIPGVGTISTGNGIKKPTIHGLSGNRIAIINAGVKLEGQQWGREHAPEIGLNQSSEITIVKGVSALKYGSEAMAGAIILTPKKGLGEKGVALSVDAGYQSNGNGQSNGVNIPFNIGGKYSLTGYLGGAIVRKGNYSSPSRILTNTGYKESSYNGLLSADIEGYKLVYLQSAYQSEIGIFSGAHIGNVTDLLRAVENGSGFSGDTFTYQITEPRQDVFHETQKFEVEKQWKTWSGKMILSRQYNRRQELDQLARQSSRSFPGTQFEITTHQANIHFKKPGKKVTYQWGAQGNFQKNTYEGSYFIPGYYRNQIGAFALAKYYLSTESNLEFGLRQDWAVIDSPNPRNVEGSFEKRASVFSYQILYDRIYHDFQITAQHGRAWRMPGPNELFANGLHHGAARVEEGNVNLKPEITYNSNLDFNYRPKSNWGLNLNLYANYFTGLIYLKPQPEPVLTIRGAFPHFVFEQDRAWHYGADAGLDYKINKRYSAEVAGSLTRIDLLGLGNTVTDLPPENIRIRIERSVGKERKSRIWIQNQWFNKQHQTPSFSNEQSSEYFSAITAAPPAYNLISVGWMGDANLSKDLDFSYFVTVENLLNHEYRSYTDSFRYFASQPGVNVKMGMKIKIANHKK